ncbi:MAG TPA: alpha-2-macroglobulin family protein [Niabella sp.]|nr:alpha-2-macroglobulin family protein [Niabella sp.]HOZ95627.1 alpha-2-macroglobulin family protein [Niabella sp.]HQW13867.1 alpha-2-macroglobulin family protein [Niabella sp.]HQX19240.1 alpha-2-macroglobulin family protein [Niabella sp.]HQX41041.1 alpha-2-macroglobulin family protein [Niabella sp.]
MSTKAQIIKNYEKDWKQVDENLNKGLPTSALTLVRKIYAKASTEKQDAQIIKSLAYMSSLQSENRENNELASIKEIEKAIGTSREPVTAMLNSYLAGIYQNYFERNRYRLYGRTNTVSLVKNNPATWTIDDFTKKISELYLSSLQNEKLLQQTPLKNFDALIIKGNTRSLRPTLYDLLAYHALEYFESSERSISQPAYKFEINQPEAFADASNFANFSFRTQDSLSLSHKALTIFQSLIRFHLNDNKPDALIDLDIARLEYVNEHAVLTNKDQLYYQALEKIAKKFPDNAYAAQARYLMALEQRNKGLKLKEQNLPNIKELIIAKEMTESIMKEKPASEGKANATNLYNEIMQPSFSFEIEKVNIPNEPFRVLANFKNTNKVYVRVIKATTSLKNIVKDNRNYDTYWNTIADEVPLKAWEQLLPDSRDYLHHSAEIKVDGIPVGEYYILTSLNKGFTRTSNILGLTHTYVSNISFVHAGKDFFVLNRNSGQPLTSAMVQSWTRRYDYNSSKYVNTKLDKYTTDQNGHFDFPSFSSESINRQTNNDRNFQFEITHKNDKLFIDEDTYHYYYYNDFSIDKKTQTNTFLFTDRSIYRPGQTVYFKGIMLNRQNDGRKADILPNEKTTVTLYDANHQKVDSIRVSSNEYGSFHGVFQLPKSGLNGIFTISTTKNTGSISFRMEEYKRPKFFVEFEKTKGTYKLNDDIHISGMAKAYAGNNIDGAWVKYRVVREARFPYPWLFWRGWWPNIAPLEIAHGETKTDNDGRFSIGFQALPDLSIDKKNDPVFEYKIYADITDINGETRSGEDQVSVGYKSLLLTVDVPKSIETDQLKSIKVRTENMAGLFEKSRVMISVFRLKPEQRLLRNRYWNAPDTFVLSKEEYIKNFPNDIYDQENEPKNWPKAEKVFDQTFMTDSTNKIFLNKTDWSAGYYAIETNTQDKDGNEVKDVQYIELINNKQKTTAFPQYLTVKNPDPMEPGEKTTIEISSSATDVFLVQGISQPDTKYQTFRLNQSSKSFDFTASEADRGGYGVTYLFVKNNRFFSSQNQINVPWTNKDLKVEYTTFRDKTLPGSEEKWTVRITGPKGEKAAAEMLASMYDASLDQFASHAWNKPSFWYQHQASPRWNSTTNFSAQTSKQDIHLAVNYINFDKEYDQLFGEINPHYQNRFEEPMVMRGAEMVGSVQMESDAMKSESKMVKSKNISMSTTPLASGAAQTDSAKSVNKPEQSATSPLQIRKNFNETAFFFPDLKTDKDGAISFSFTMPEALTKWKFQALAHTKDLAFGYSSKEIITQKDLMVQPNAPRFIREGDKMVLSSKIVNLSDKEISGMASLELLDPATNEVVNRWFKNDQSQQPFTISAGQSKSVGFPLEVPASYTQAITWRIVAKVTKPETSSNLSDGEENMLPVLTNRMLVTETLPLALRGHETKQFSFDKLRNSGQSNTLTTQALTVEYTSNPAWYAVQALPYMMEYPFDCAEQTWNRYYANSLASMIANSSPKIKNIFDKWRTEDTAALLSNLQKNQELKSVLLAETPWVLEANNETQQKRNIGVLFDLVRMGNEMNSAFEKLKQMQSSNGGFVWFKGGPDDRYMTQYILTGIGHLMKLNAAKGPQITNLSSVVQSAIPYLDKKLKEDYETLLKIKTDKKKYIPSYHQVQYLYMRSFFPTEKIAKASEEAYNFFMQRAKATWVSQNKYMQGMIALALHRHQDATTPNAILKSLKETAINNQELGMYYKDASKGWWWHQAPIERQALIIEAFEEIAKDNKTADDLRTWLLKNKQTNHWESTKATAEACYALLLQGTEWLSVSPEVEIRLGDLTLNTAEEKTEAGTGYFKKMITSEKVTPDMGVINVTVKQVSKVGTMPSWGSVYWQYFENLDKINFAETPLKLNKKLFVETNSDRGPVLKPVDEGEKLKIGDKIKVRVELQVDRDMEYVHMKDMRASGFEPANVLSTYKWQGGLGYYESTKDASTDFFFGYLPKGNYVFEYSLFAGVAGNFSNGITTIQCMYAPEFTSHSEGIRVVIE